LFVFLVKALPKEKMDIAADGLKHHCTAAIHVMPDFSHTAGVQPDIEITSGEFHDQGDAEWIVLKRQLRGHNDTPFGLTTPSRPWWYLVV
jgi:hypothetical protein